MICHTVFEQGSHKWLVFGQDPERPDNVIDTNQVVIVCGESVTLLDPGGLAIFPSFLSAVTERISVDKIDNIILSHQDPDVASSLPLWRQVCKPEVNIYVSALWTDFVTHLDSETSVIAIPDEGMDLVIDGGVTLQVIPAHYLHSPGNFSVYDSTAGVLFSGEIGSANVPPSERDGYVVRDFDRYAQYMVDFHRRWMAARHARDAWVARAMRLEVDAMVPQRGLVMEGGQVNLFLHWFSALELGAGIEAMYERGVPRPSTDGVRPPSIAADDDIALPESGLEPAPEQQPIPAPDPLAAVGAADREAFSELLGEAVPEEAPRGSAEPGKEYRLVTRSDFDGLVCAVLLEELDMIDDILFVHPNDMQEGRVAITDQDITTNLPYVPGCHLAFDHHMSEVARLGQKFDNHIINPDAPSAARVVYEYYGAAETFPSVSPDLMEAVDKGDSAQFTMDEVLDPAGWPLLNFIMDARTGLGRFRGFRIPNYELMMELIEACRRHTIDEILELPDVKERVDLMLEQQDGFKEQITRCTTVHGNLAVLNLLEEETVYVGNRFMVYALFPQCNISMHVMWGRDKQNIVFAVGKSIFDKSSKTNVGELMLQYGGGGHHAAGTCQSDPILAETVKQALITKINEDG